MKVLVLLKPERISRAADETSQLLGHTANSQL